MRTPAPSQPTPATATPVLLIKWRQKTFTLPYNPNQTLNDLKSHLSTLTTVPPTHQKLLLPTLPPSTCTLSTIFPKGPPTRPLTLLATPPSTALPPPPPLPSPPPVAHDDQASDLSAAVVTNDLHQLTEYSPPSPPPPSPPRAPLSLLQPYEPFVRDVGPGALDRRRERIQRITLQRLRQRDDDRWRPDDVEDDASHEHHHDAHAHVHDDSDDTVEASDDDVPHHAHVDAAVTPVSLESLDRMLANAVKGADFRERHMPSLSSEESGEAPLVTLPHHRLSAAIADAKRQLKLLAILVFTLPPSPTLPNTTFLTSLQTSSTLRESLNTNYLIYTADISPLPQNGTTLLERLDLHSTPAILIVAEMPTGPALVDMFAIDFFGNPSLPSVAADIAARLLQTHATFDPFLDTARAVRAASDHRASLIADQDRALEHAQAEDRAAAERHQQPHLPLPEPAPTSPPSVTTPPVPQRASREQMAAARAALPVEPGSAGARVAVRMPDGRRVIRRFHAFDTLADLYTFCCAEGFVRGSFVLVGGYPSRVWPEEEFGSETVQNAGFVPAVTLNVDLV